MPRTTKCRARGAAMPMSWIEALTSAWGEQRPTTQSTSRPGSRATSSSSICPRFELPTLRSHLRKLSASKRTPNAGSTNLLSVASLARTCACQPKRPARYSASAWNRMRTGTTSSAPARIGGSNGTGSSSRAARLCSSALSARTSAAGTASMAARGTARRALMTRRLGADLTLELLLQLGERIVDGALFLHLVELPLRLHRLGRPAAELLVEPGLGLDRLDLVRHAVEVLESRRLGGYRPSAALVGARLLPQRPLTQLHLLDPRLERGKAGLELLDIDLLLGEGLLRLQPLCILLGLAPQGLLGQGVVSGLHGPDRVFLPGLRLGGQRLDALGGPLLVSQALGDLAARLPGRILHVPDHLIDLLGRVLHRVDEIVDVGLDERRKAAEDSHASEFTRLPAPRGRSRLRSGLGSRLAWISTTAYVA